MKPEKREQELTNMRGISSLRSLLTNTSRTLLLLLLSVFASQAQPGSAPKESRTGPASTEQRTARHFESIRKSPQQELAFLIQMPKGADLHNHLSGAVYAESYIRWASDNGLCVNIKTMALSAPTPPSKCDPKSDQPLASTALTNSGLYNQMIDAWSMRNWQKSGQTGHDHFFDTFIKFGPATWDQNGKMLAEVVARAARGHVLYLELMLTPDGGVSSQIGKNIKVSENLNTTLNELKSAGIDRAEAAGVSAVQAAETEKNQLLKCATPQADAGCSVTIRYIAQVSRGADSGTVFAQMVTGFALANDPSSKVVALNLVQPEDSPASMQNFSLQMKMLNFLGPLYPRAHVSLHAGELVPGIVPPKGLTFHIRDSVTVGHAERIGHGVDILHEDAPSELMKELVRRNVLIEICLSSNDLILGISGRQHPLATYMKYGVPVALATDDEGVSRSDISHEFLKGADDQGLGYLQLKMMTRNSLQYAFISGGSLWSDARKFLPVTQCAQDFASMKLTSNSCKQYVTGSEKAKLQWRLEEEFNTFERQY
jgi:adenosine deaminase